MGTPGRWPAGAEDLVGAPGVPSPEPGRTAGGLLDATPAVRAAESPGETVDQVLDRNLVELLQELRVAFTGVQILFAFLLGLAFTQRFEEVDGVGLAAYTTALMTAALATLVLIAPVSFHRLVFRRRQKAALVAVADRLLMVGLALLIPAISSSVLLILHVALPPLAGDRGQLAHGRGGRPHLVRPAAGHPPHRPRRDPSPAPRRPGGRLSAPHRPTGPARWRGRAEARGAPCPSSG